MRYIDLLLLTYLLTYWKKLRRLPPIPLNPPLAYCYSFLYVDDNQVSNNVYLFFNVDASVADVQSRAICCLYNDAKTNTL